MANTAIKNAGQLYINGFAIHRNSATVIEIDAGQCRDSSNVNDIVLDSAIELNVNSLGAGGLDTGTVAGFTIYAIHIVGDSTGYNSPAAIFSLSKDDPVVPGPYDMHRHIGWLKTDGTPEFVNFYVSGSGNDRWLYYSEPESITGFSDSAGYTSTALTNWVPDLGDRVVFLLDLSVHFKPAGGSLPGTVEFKPFGASNPTNGNAVMTAETSVVNKHSMIIMCRCNSAGTPYIEHKNTTIDTTFEGYVNGYRYSL